MNVTVSVDIGDILDLAATFLDGRKAAEDLTKRLVRTVAADSRERFAAGGPGWAPREQSDEETAAHVARAIEAAKGGAVEVIKKKLNKDLLRAQKKASLETVEHHRALVRDFARQVEGGLRGFSLVKPTDDKKLAKKLASVEKRLGRTHDKLVDRAKTDKGRLLGALSRANRPSSKGLHGEVRNMVKFSGVQNDGGQVGNGATLPARPFLSVTPELEARLDHTAETWLGSLGGE